MDLDDRDIIGRRLKNVFRSVILNHFLKFHSVIYAFGTTRVASVTVMGPIWDLNLSECLIRDLNISPLAA
jgi:hypothetical protein